MQNWEIEDYLTDKEVFTNGLSGEISSLGAYMTCISIKKLIVAFEQSPYTKEDWQGFLTYLEGFFYLAPTFKLLYLFLDKLMQCENKMVGV